MERLRTGNARLDDVLHGGLVRNAITLLVGAPGSGKTLLAEQCLFANASLERPGLYLSTVSEPLDKLLRYAQELEFFDARQVGRTVFYDELGTALEEEGLGAVLERVDLLVKEHRPGIVVIDSFKALQAFAPSEGEFRRFLHGLAGRLTALAISAIWVGEYSAQDSATSAEFAVADAVIALATKYAAERSIRYLSVLKLRGSDFASGEHAYRVSSRGLLVYPRLTGSGGDERLAHDGNRVSTGIHALDEALGEGCWPGSTTLVAGPSGAGKTLMGLHFLYGGAALDEPGLLVSFQESRSQLARITAGFGWSATEPAVTIMDRSPVDLHIDELVYELLEEAEETGARRVVLDSLNDLMVAVPDALRFREFVFALVQRLARARRSTMFTLETPELFRISRLGELGVSHVADNVVLLQHLQRGSEMKRALTVLKSRGTSHTANIHEFDITSAGIILGPPIDLREGWGG